MLMVSSLSVTRDSVAAGDDCDAPHFREFRFPKPLDLESAIILIVGQNYLASISGGKATWIAEANDNAVAVVAQQWKAPKFVRNASQTHFSEPQTDIRVHFGYMQQSDPDSAFQRLS